MKMSQTEPLWKPKNRIILRHIEIDFKSVAKIQNKDPDLQTSDWLLHAIVVNKVVMWLKCDVSTFCVWPQANQHELHWKNLPE